MYVRIMQKVRPDIGCLEICVESVQCLIGIRYQRASRCLYEPLLITHNDQYLLYVNWRSCKMKLKYYKCLVQIAYKTFKLACSVYIEKSNN